MDEIVKRHHATRELPNCQIGSGPCLWGYDRMDTRTVRETSVQDRMIHVDPAPDPLRNIVDSRGECVFAFE